MSGKLQRIFRRRASGSSSRGVAGLASRLPAGLRSRRSGSKPLPWGKRAEAAQPPAPGTAAQPPAPGTTAQPAAPGTGGTPAKRLPFGKRAGGAQGTGRTPAKRLAWPKRATTAQPAAQITGGAPATTEVVATAGSESFRDRGQLRRRLRFLRRARELAFRDVGGLIFDMRRFGRDRPDLIEAKLNALAAVDAELRAIERVLDDRRPIHELREPGLSSCQRCGALHASEDNFCPRCGLQFGGAQAMGEVGGAIAAPPQPPPAPVAQPTAPTLLGFSHVPPPAPAAPAAEPPAPAPQQQQPPPPAPPPPPGPEEQPTRILRPPDPS